MEGSSDKQQRVLLLSAYDAPSHQYLNKGLMRYFADWQWQCLSLPARYYSWRVRGNSLSWGFGEQRTLLEQSYDLIIATSMVDLSSLRGFVPQLAGVPTVVYCHENPFAYPDNMEHDKHYSPVERQITYLYTLLCADALVFNSHYNRDTCIEGIATLLKKMPDAVPPGLVDQIEKKAMVLPVPLIATDSETEIKTDKKTTDVVEVVWNHRWEYDKGPQQLLEIVRRVIDKQLPLRFHLVGQQFRTVPEALTTALALLKEHNKLGQHGYLPEADYRNLLQRSDMVLSTALHEFQGLAVMEAVACGCVPVVPDRLAYQEYYPQQFRYCSTLDNLVAESEAAVNLIESLLENLADTQSRVVKEVTTPEWSTTGERYRELFANL